MARQAHSLGDTAQAVDLLVRRLDAQYSGELAQELQPLVPALDAEARLDLMRRADVWLTQEPRDAGLLLLLGRLALACSCGARRRAIWKPACPCTTRWRRRWS